jgi:hypothetical protein
MVVRPLRRRLAALIFDFDAGLSISMTGSAWHRPLHVSSVSISLTGGLSHHFFYDWLWPGANSSSILPSLPQRRSGLRSSITYD